MDSEDRTFGAWEPIETAPRDGTQILAFAQGSPSGRDPYYGVAQWTESGLDMGFVAGWFWDFAIRPTHWMRLPPPPQANASER